MFTFFPNTLILQNTICNQDYNNNNNNNNLSKRIKQKGKQKIASEEKFIYIYIYVCSMMKMISLKNLENAERRRTKRGRTGRSTSSRSLFTSLAIGKSFISKGNIRYIVSRDRWSCIRDATPVFMKIFEKRRGALDTRESYICLPRRIWSRKVSTEERVRMKIFKNPSFDILVRRVRKEEKIKDSGNKTSLWLIILRIYRLCNCRHQFAREGNNFKMIISIN